MKNPNPSCNHNRVTTGESESLHAKIDPITSSDCKFMKSRINKEMDMLDYRQSKKHRILSVLTDDCVVGVYQPTTKETRDAYETMLALIGRQLGGQPLDVVIAAADEILGVLKDGGLDNYNKQREIQRLLYEIISPATFLWFKSVGRLITDYGSGHDDGLDDTDDSCYELVPTGLITVNTFLDMEQDDGDYDDLAHGLGLGAIKMGGGIIVDVDQGVEEGRTLNVQDIDAYWLHRKIFQAYDQQQQHIEPQQTQKLAEELFKILAEGGDDGQVETKLLVHLQFDKVSLVKYLLKNRMNIVWCIRLVRAQDEEERKKIEEEMIQLGSNLVVRQEARRLKDQSCDNGDQGLTGTPGSDADFMCLKGQRQLLDLDSLAFSQGGLSMANINCELPSGTYKKHNKYYEEVHVPALRPKPLAVGEELIRISDMPDWARPPFEGMSRLNRVESKVYDAALFSAQNLLLCAPTGAGKTNVAILTILQQIALNRNEDGSFNRSNHMIVYVAPMRALVAEVVGDLSNRLNYYGVQVKELSGDHMLTRQHVEETQIIVTTPEKWDIITRRSGNFTYTRLVKLLIIDEIHLLHDNRGPILESIVARTVRQIETTKEHIRLVGLSATLPNYEDVAKFLRVDLKKGLFHFDNSYRPCPLAQQCIGITAKNPLQRYQIMNNICYDKVISVAGQHQVLIFVHSRKETEKTAYAIKESALINDTITRFVKQESATREILCEHTEYVKSTDLKDLFPYGIAIHHDGLNSADRQIVEKLFADGHLQVLVSTATLAWGVNLPAHTVIIKGTRVYNPGKGAWTELSPLDVEHMLGRAGRPQYDTCGEGIILTGHSELQYYVSVINQQLPTKSHFLSKLADHLNAEILLGTVQNAREACNWLGYTYMYVRMLRNPTLYGLGPDALSKDVLLAERRADLVHTAAALLEKESLIKYDRRSGYFQVTGLGRTASHYYITHGTIRTYNEHLRPTMGDIELCHLFSLSDEFKHVTVRQDEKHELKMLLGRVPIRIKESLEEPSTKINVLLQAHISRLKLEGSSLMSDMVYISQNAGRLMRALFEIILKRGWAQVAEKALNLCKMISQRMWAVQSPLRQFHGLPREVLIKMEKKDLSWERYYDLSSQELGELFQLNWCRLVKKLHECVHQFPKLILAAHIQSIAHTILRVQITVTPDFQWEDKVHGFVEPFWVFVEDSNGENILHHEYFLLKEQYIDKDHTLIFTVPVYKPLHPHYFIRVVSDKWIGSQTVLRLFTQQDDIN